VLKSKGGKGRLEMGAFQRFEKNGRLSKGGPGPKLSRGTSHPAPAVRDAISARDEDPPRAARRSRRLAHSTRPNKGGRGRGGREEREKAIGLHPLIHT